MSEKTGKGITHSINGIFGFALGVLLTSTLSLGSILIFQTEGFWSKNWFSLLTIFVPVLAAFLALFAVQKQILAASMIYNQERLAKLRAARAFLPIALSELMNKSDLALEHLIETPNEGISDVLELSPSILETLKSCIEYSNGVNSDWLIAILYWFQVYRSRTLDRTSRRSVSSQPNQQSAADWIIFNRLCSHVLPFARGEAENDCIPSEYDKYFEFPLMIEIRSSSSNKQVIKNILDKSTQLRKGTIIDFIGKADSD